MGAGVSMPTAEITEAAEEVVKTFVPIYTKQYALSTIYQLKQEKNARQSQLQLLKPPTPSEPLQVGLLTKLGAVKKSWKLRYFVALNEADNYQIRYYVDEAAYKAAPDKPKGSINLCWYRVERSTTDADKKELGEFSFKAMPWWASDRRRAWFVRADTEEALKKWVSTFEYAARKAGPPFNPDPVMRRAFTEAYRETRWRLDEWGWYYNSRTEEEQLGVLVVDRCERTCMRPVYAKVPSGRMEAAVRGQIVKVLDSTVGAAVGAAWKSASAAIEAQKGTVKAAVDEHLGAVLSKQVEVKDFVSSAILAALQPVVEKGAAPLLGPVSRVFLGPLHEAYHEAVSVFLAAMRTAIAKAAAAATPEEAAAAWDAGLRDFQAETYWYWGSLYPAFAKVRDLTQYNPSTSNAAFKLELPLDDLLRLLDGVELWQIERQFEESIRELSRHAVYTLKVRTESQSSADKEALLLAVAAQFIHDAKVRSLEDMAWIFSSVLLPPIRKAFLPTVKGALEPVRDLIPEPLAPLLDVDEMVGEILEDVVHGTIYQIVVPATNSALAPLHPLAAGHDVDPALDPMTLPRGPAAEPAPVSADTAAATSEAPSDAAPALEAAPAVAAVEPAVVAADAPAAHSATESVVASSEEAAAASGAGSAATEAPAPQAESEATESADGVPASAAPEVPAAAALPDIAPATDDVTSAVPPPTSA